MKLLLSTLFFILSLFSAFAETTVNAHEEAIVICGNGRNTVEMNANAQKSNLTLSYRKHYNILSLSVANAIMQSRAEDMQTGEIIEKYITDSGEFTQRTFVSRKDDVIVVYLSADKGTINQVLKVTPPNSKSKKNAPTTKTTIKASENSFLVNNSFAKALNTGDTLLVGNEAVIRVFTNNTKTNLSGEDIKLKDASKVALVIATKPLVSNSESNPELLNSKIENLLSQNGINLADKKSKRLPEQVFEKLFGRHLKVHQVESKAISFTLQTADETDNTISEMYNRMFYKGLCYGELQAIDTDNFSALPKLNQLVKQEIQASFLYDYYLYTLDKNFLKEKVYPYMIKVREEVEKTLRSKDNFGFYVISKNSPTMEVTALIVFYRDLISTCNILSNDMDENMSAYQELIPKCEKVLSLLPPYQIDRNEEMRRELLGETLNNQQLPDVPQLLGLFYRNDPIIYRNYDIREACRTSIKTCINYRRKQNIGGLDAGFIQLALSSAALGDGDTAYQLISDSKPYWSDQSNREIVPILTKMLLQSYYSPESNRCYLNILPAAPTKWTNGELKGAPVRGGITIKELIWDASVGIKTTLESKTDITLDIYIHGRFVKKVELQANTPHTFTAPWKAGE